MEEIWKDIKGYEGVYQVSSFGNVRSYTRRVLYPSGRPHTYTGKLVKQEKTKDGYRRVQLSKDSVDKKFSVHRLVAETSIENPNNFPQVNHKDENRENNRLENLEWCSASYNINYGTRNAKISSRAKMVKQIDKNGHIVAVYSSAMVASKSIGCDLSFLYKCCRGEVKTCSGYRWEYV